MSYDVLKNRLTNGEPYLLATALERINALADNLEITQEQAEELTAIAQKHGLDAMPENLEGRVETLEDALNTILSKYGITAS